jgi:16S rRNA (guanine966-N2)-methyltransferase
MQNNQVRIIAGVYRGRKITFPNIEGLRPTSDRVRETVFNWLQHDIKDANCLDLFAGSGALGFEALSRGAAHVDFVDLSRDAINAINDNITRFKAPNATAHQSQASDFLKNPKSPYDIVFLDPPFDSTLLSIVITNLSTQLNKNALIYIETPRHSKPECDIPWQKIKETKTRHVVASLYTC